MRNLIRLGALLFALSSCDSRSNSESPRTSGGADGHGALPGDEFPPDSEHPGGSTASGSSTGESNASGGASSPGSAGGCQEAAVRKSYTPSLFSSGDDPSADESCSILNPERGFRGVVDLLNLPNLGGRREQGQSTVYGYVLIPDYINKDLDAEVLGPLEASFDKLRSAGLKVILRVYYAPAMDPDAPLSQVLTHIEQLKPLLRSNSDVIAAMHAGFVGAWGEWHSSTNQLTEPTARKAIFDALLEALPAARMILARRPSHKSEAYGGPLTAESAYSESHLGRVGHLNDCFLASDTDFGTYQGEGEKEYASADSAFTAVDGETCALNPPRSECESALAELAEHHWSLLNMAYHGGVLDSWRDGGCFEHIACRLGYRFALLGLAHPSLAAPGEALNVELRMINDGFARAFNARSALLVLQREDSLYRLPLALDLRELAPGLETSFCLAAQLPATLSAGEYRLGLWLPDASQSLETDPRYAVRLVNDVDWVDGINWFDSTLRIK